MKGGGGKNGLSLRVAINAQIVSAVFSLHVNIAWAGS